MLADFKPRSLLSNACHFSVAAWTRDSQDLANERRQEFAAGRECALRALQQAGCKNANDLAAGPLRFPLWPLGFVGSISHTHGFSIAAAAPTSALAGIGIDAERVISLNRATRIQNKILSKKEITLIQEDFFSLGVSVIFSAKESLYKALNPIVQKTIGFHDVEALQISPLDKTEGEVRFRLLKSLSPRWNEGFEFTARFYVQNLIVTALEIPQTT